jgi:hypothetical protein
VLPIARPPIHSERRAGSTLCHLIVDLRPSAGVGIVLATRLRNVSGWIPRSAAMDAPTGARDEIRTDCLQGPSTAADRGYQEPHDVHHEDHTVLLIALAMLAAAWLGVVVIVVGICVDAARCDRALLARAAAQTLLLRSTWRPVRTRIFRSSHSDQPAT